jgi:tetrahydromethanopterin S-methyltransferase subunit E
MIAVDGNMTLFTILACGLIVTLITWMAMVGRMVRQVQRGDKVVDVTWIVVLAVLSTALMVGVLYSSPTTFRSEDGTKEVIIK